MKVLFVYSGNQVSCDSNLVLSQADSLIVLGIKVEFYAIKGHGFFGYLQNIIPLRKQIRREKYDLLHAHYGLCGLVTLLACKNHTKLIISFMGNDLLGDHSRNGKSTIFGRLLVFANQLCAKFADHIIVKSNEMADKIAGTNISILPNGVDLERFKSIDKHLSMVKVGWDEKFKHILFMASPERKEKNFKLAESAIKQLNRDDIHLHLLHNIPQNEVNLYFNASDLCLLTSYHEGSPNVIKEAMACNIPIVTTSVGDVSWVIGGTEGCYICTFQTLELASSLRKSLEFSLVRMRTNGRERIKEIGLDSESIAKKLVEVYKKVLNN